MNKLQKAFDEIGASEELKISTLAKCKEKKIVNHIPGAIAACLALIMALGGINIFHLSKAEAAYISIDVNPSIGLSLNKFKRVISADAYNDEGREIISELDLNGNQYSEAVDSILKLEEAKGYDISAAEIYIEGSSDRLNNEINDTISKQCPNANTSCHNAHNKEKAAAYDISPGKYYIIEQIIKYGGTIDDYKDKSMKELREIYLYYTGEKISGKGHANGNGRHAGNSGEGKHRHR